MISRMPLGSHALTEPVRPAVSTMVYCAQDTPQVRQEDFSAPGRSRSSATVAGRDGGAGQGFHPAAGEEDGTKEGGLQGLRGKHPQLPLQRKKTGNP